MWPQGPGAVSDSEERVSGSPGSALIADQVAVPTAVSNAAAKPRERVGPTAPRAPGGARGPEAPDG
eukprot:2345643-Pyramimonas_sp.AAC.1